MDTTTAPNITFSVISPVYRADEILPELVKRICSHMDEIGHSYEIILVDDRSPDDSWSVIKNLCNSYTRLRGIRLSKNSGQQKALQAGLNAAKGDYLIVMDCDLQEDSRYFKELYQKINEGYDIVLCRRKSRKFNLWRNGLTRLFYAILSLLTNSSFSFYNTAVMSMIKRKVAVALLGLNSKNWFYFPNLDRVGFERTFIEIEHYERHSGKSSYSLKKLYRHGINLILGQSLRLLNISIGIGAFFVLVSFVWAIVLVVIYFKGTPPNGYTSMMVSLLLFTGLILSAIGILGLYLGKVFQQVKDDPDYFVDETINL